jgi:DNA helicase-2/ATP-dependent DNA helicase PcrA
VLVNGQDVVSFQRASATPRRGLGQTTLARLAGHANTVGESVWEVAREPEAVPALGSAAVKAVGRFMSVMERLAERVESAAVGDLLQETLDETGYMDALRAERTIEADGRVENLEELVRVAREYDASAEEPSVEEFLQQVALFADQDGLQDDEGQVTLMTLHNAKGLEYPVVFVIGMEDGVFPHMRAVEAGDVEEERRLCYVGITRAMRELYLTFARRRNLYGSSDYNLPSRFLDEIPAQLTDVQMRAPAASSTWGAAPSATDAARPTPGPGPSFRMGDDVVHAAFGAGTVLAVEPGGIVVVRFKDRSERKLMADYAPLRRA